MADLRTSQRIRLDCLKCAVGLATAKLLRVDAVLGKAKDFALFVEREQAQPTVNDGPDHETEGWDTSHRAQTDTNGAVP